jgi:SAM-dependent methyltransferase
MSHEPEVEHAVFWENRYLERGQSWSGLPNAALEREAAALEPGSALDVGCGEGGGADWLASAGWRVTAVDISATALAFGAARAAEAGLDIRWVEADLASWRPDGAFDLASSHFLHSPVELPRDVILRRAAAAVAPGGTLLIVGHATPPQGAGHGHGGGHGDGSGEVSLPMPDEVLASLDLEEGEWSVVTSALMKRLGIGPDGTTMTLADSVLRLRRRAIAAGPAS